MTLFTVYDDGVFVACCDEKCYNSDSDECHCICGGMNHGIGRALAIRTTLEMLDSLVLAYCVHHPGFAYEVEL